MVVLIVSILCAGIIASGNDMFTVATVDMKAADAARKFASSLKQTGFAVVKNHNVDPALITSTYDEWRVFLKRLASANEASLACGSDVPETVVGGAAAAGEENVLDGVAAAGEENVLAATTEAVAAAERNMLKRYLYNREAFDGYFPGTVSETAKGFAKRDLKHFYHLYYPWGRYPSEVSSQAAQLFQQMWTLGEELLQWIDDEMDTEVKAKMREPLTSVLGMNQTLMRIIHYPSKDGTEEEGALRAAPHEDINLITILPAECGLQVHSKAEGVWHDVPCHNDGAIVVNIGDMLQELTEYHYISTTHRVVQLQDDVAGRMDRMAIPVFMHARPEAYISGRYLTAKDYLTERLVELGLA